MKKEDITKKINEYINDWQLSPQSAIMLNGEWGCGKTHYVKDYIKKLNHDGINRAWYISVFGLKNSDDLDNKLFEAAHPILSKNNQKILGISYNIIRGAVKHGFGFEMNDVFSEIITVTKDKNNNLSDCKIIFIDDVERTDIPLKELYGYFSELIDKDIRIVFIVHKDSITDKNDFEKLNEKLIFETYTMTPNYDEAIKYFWEEEFKQEKEKFTYLECRIKNIVKKLHQNNLRNVHRIIHKWKIFSRSLPESISNEKLYISDIFDEFIVFSIDYISHISDKAIDKDKHIENMKQIMKDFKSVSFVPEIKGANLWPHIIYEGRYDDSEWIHSQFVQNKKNYDNKKLEIEEDKKKAGSHLNKLKNLIYNESKQVSIKDDFEQMITEFNNGYYARFDEITAFISVYLEFMNEDILPKEHNEEKLIQTLETFIQNHREQIHALPGIENVRKENLMSVKNKKLQECIYNLFDLAQASVGYNQQNIFKEKEAFLNYITTDKTKALTDMQNVKFLEHLNLDDIFDWMGEDVKVHKSFLTFLKYRYRENIENQDMNKNDYSEIQYVEELGSKYDTLCKSLANNYRIDYRDFKYIHDEYINLIQYMRNQKNKSLN